MELQFTGGMYSGRSIASNGQECVNWYPEVYGAQEQNKTNMALIPTPGLKYIATSTGACRSGYTTSSGRHFYVAGRNLYELSTSGKVTKRSELVTLQGRVSFSDNGSSIESGAGMLITDGYNTYLYNLANNSIVQISGQDLPPNSHVVFINGRFVVNEIGSQKFWWSNLYNGLQWDGLSFASGEGLPDSLTAIGSINNELWLFGTQSVEVWAGTGDGLLPFARVSGAFFNNGTIAPYSVATNGSNIFWLGSSAQGHGQVWMATNYQPQKISTTAIDYVIGQIDDITDAIGMAYTQEGHNFYMLTFPRGNRSICFDLTTGYWHERAYFDESTSVQGRHLANYMSFFDGRTICGDYRNGNTYELDLDTCTDNGGTIVRERTCAHVHSDRKRLYYKEFEIDCERGTGDQDGQGEAPQVFLQTSDDGGYNWSSEKWATFGKVGKYKTRMRWQRLGKSRDRVFRIKASDPVKMIILGARMDVESDL